MSTLATWDKITGALSSTDTTFGGNWGNLISDFMNGIDIGLSDPNKRPRPNTLTRWKFEKFGLLDGDESHHVLFSVNDIDTGSDRKIVIRRMNSPNETDYMVMENLTQTLTAKSINADNNTITNIDVGNLAASSDIITTTNTKTMANKTLISPQISTILNGAATLTLPGSTQNILGRTTIDTLTNKTIDSITSTLKNLGVYKYQIFKDGSTYYCRNNQSGAIEVSNASPNTVIQFVLTQGGSCWVHGPTDYVMTGSGTPYFDLPKEPTVCEFYMAADAWIVVPNGYTGIVFRLQNSTTLHCTGHKLGVNIKEAGTPTLNWTGILIEGMGGTNSRGVYDCHLKYAHFIKPDIGIKFNNATGSTKGFITTNYFDNIMMWAPKTAGVDFQMDEPYSTTPPNINGIHRNRFRNMLIQGNGSDTTVGVRNIRHKDNSFYGCYVADFVGNSKTSTIHADATSTIIDGGSMDVTGRFEDNSTAQTTKIRSEFRHTQIGRITPGIFGTNIDIVPPTSATTNTTSWWNADVNERFYIQKNDSTNQYLFDFVRHSSGGALRPVIFRQYDNVGGGAGIVEAFRIETDAGLRVNSNKFRMRDSNDSHNYNWLVSDINAHRDITVPPLTGNDQLTFDAHATTLTNKTMSGASNTFSNIPWASILKTGSVLADISNVILTSAAEYDILYRNASSQWVNLPKGTNNRFLGINGSGVLQYNFVGNANITAHTSTQISITAKGQLNSQIGYKDESNWLTDAMMATHTTSKISTTSKSLLNNQIAYKDENAWLTGSMMVAPNVFQLIKLPTFGMKKGGFTGTSTATGWGIVGGLTAIGTFTALDIDTTYGSYAPRSTGNVAGNNAGFSYANALSMRKFNPILAMLVRTSHVSLNRMYFGWKSTAASPASLTDDPLANLSGVMFLQRSGDTTWQICSNSGTATSTIVDTLATISTTIPSNLQIRAINASSKFQWSADGGDTWTDVTGNFPAETTKLFYVGEGQTNEGVIHRIDTFAMEVATEK